MQQMNYVLMLVISNLLLSAWAVTAVPNNGIAPFNRSPLLAGVSVTSDRPQAGDSIHYFTMTLPERAGKRFAKLSLSFTEQNRDKTVAPIRFDLASTKAFAGSIKAGGGAIEIKDAWVDETGVLWIEFKAPVASKTQLTLALKTLKSSPAAAYNYGIAAYPETQSSAVFVGDGTITLRR